jgi:LPXTG-site transpeptidase (sortase) family protein
VLAYWSLRPGPEPDAAVLGVDDAVASSTPATVPPLATLPSMSANEPDTDAPEPTGPTTTTIPLSPLAELLGDRGSAVPTEIEPRLRPIGLTIDDIFVDDPVRPVGLEPDGELEVPDATEIGWYRYGAAPGYPGATVLAAHVTWNGDYGPFLNLGDLDPGDQVRVALEDGSERVYEVVERTMYDKDELPRERIWRTTGDETLVLITCGGDFNPDINRYRQNIVIYAVPIA